MQHAEKEKTKRKKNNIFSDIPTQTKKNPRPSEKKHLQTKAWPELHREQRARTAFNQILIYKRKKKTKHQNFPFKLCTVCGSLRQDQICNFYWNRSISLTWAEYMRKNIT